MTFDSSEFEADVKPKPKRPDKPRWPNGRWKKRRGGGFPPWVPSDEYCKMLLDAFAAEGFPKKYLRLDRKKRLIRVLVKCRGFEETHFVFRKFYTPFHVQQFLRLYMRWTPERRNKGGRPKKPKPPKDWSLDRRTKAWRSKMLHERGKV